MSELGRELLLAGAATLQVLGTPGKHGMVLAPRRTQHRVVLAPRQTWHTVFLAPGGAWGWASPRLQVMGVQAVPPPKAGAGCR